VTDEEFERACGIVPVTIPEPIPTWWAKGRTDGEATIQPRNQYVYFEPADCVSAEDYNRVVEAYARLDVECAKAHRDHKFWKTQADSLWDRNSDLLQQITKIQEATVETGKGPTRVIRSLAVTLGVFIVLAIIGWLR
jgi:hypothetical protein